jgi:acetyltransferase-like isoleucine patch superfamily enzyme
MPRLIKRWTTKILTPLAIGINALQKPWQRLWAHACLAAKIIPPLDPSVVVYSCPEIHGTGQIHFGKNLLLYRDLYLETREQGNIKIGNDVVLSRGIHLVSYSRLEIGTGSMIGEYSSVRDANHKMSENTLLRDAGHTSAPIIIGSNVWIGRGVTIVAGVTIGDHALIGANAVVTKDIPSHTLAVGVPARPVKVLNQ